MRLPTTTSLIKSIVPIIFHRIRKQFNAFSYILEYSTVNHLHRIQDFEIINNNKQHHSLEYRFNASPLYGPNTIHALQLETVVAPLSLTDKKDIHEKNPKGREITFIFIKELTRNVH